MPVSWAVASHPGLRRPMNEDSYCAAPDLGLFVVADGMGGHVAGEIASQEAVSAIEAFVHQTADSPESRLSGAQEPVRDFPANRLKTAFRMANQRLRDLTAKQQSLRGMATTVSAVLMDGERAILAHVGDSRVYRLRDRALERLTRDHSWVEEQVRAGIMTASAARHHPWRNVVTRAINGGPDPEVDVAEVELVRHDRLMLCSDGLFAVVSDERIGDLLAQSGTLSATCQALVDAANGGGGPDNVTVLILQIDVP